jgi:hypothetical protein
LPTPNFGSLAALDPVSILASVGTPTRETKVQARLDDALCARLDYVVELAKEKGASGVSRSSVIRAALEGFLDGAEQHLAALSSPG